MSKHRSSQPAPPAADLASDGADRAVEVDVPPLGADVDAGFWRQVGDFLRDEQATSDVEYILLTAMVIFPLFVVPPMIMDTNSTFFHRVEPWVNLPFP